jgi:DNA polymerase III epsilon subunit-like protein
VIRFSIDTETGGYDPKRHPCLSIGYVIVSGTDLRILEKGEILIKGAKSHCTREALRVNQIDLKSHNLKAVKPQQAVELFNEVISRYFKDGKVCLIGQNPDFDIKFITHLYSKYSKREFIYSHRVVDLVKIWWGLEAIGIIDTTSASLDTILDYLKLPDIGQRHSALVDAENVIRVLQLLKHKFPKINI